MARKNFFNRRMKVRNYTFTADSVGGTVKTTQSIVNTKCRIRLLSGVERTVVGKDGTVTTHRIYCDNINISSSSEVVIDSVTYDTEIINDLHKLKRGLEVDVALRD